MRTQSFCAIVVVFAVEFHAHGQGATTSVGLARNEDSQVNRITPLNGDLIFDAYDAIFGNEIRKYSPKTGELSIVRDIHRYKSGNSVRVSIVHKGILYFSKDSFGAGEELWRTDGTADGTWLVKDIYPYSPFPKHIGFFCSGANYLFFVADDGVHGPELWRTDGTTEGTILVKDIHFPPYETGITMSPQPLGDIVLFRATSTEPKGELWRSDGHAENTRRIEVPELSIDGFEAPMMSMGSYVLFAGTTDALGMELWRTDGTEEGTRLLREIFPGKGGATLREFTRLGDLALFTADDREHGPEPWITDGTPEGTRLLKDIEPGGSGSTTHHVRVSGSRAYFSATTSLHGAELWMTDGAAEGAAMVADINLGSASSGPYSIATVGDGTAFFSARTDEYGEELWFTDGSTQGTRIVSDIWPGENSSEPHGALAFDGNVYFTASDGRHGREFWRSDGAQSGTKMIADIHTPTIQPKSASPLMLTIERDRVFFIGQGSDLHWRWWCADNSEAPPQLLSEDIKAPTSAAFHQMLAVRGGMYLLYQGENARPELWYSDGAPAGATRAAVLNGAGAGAARLLGAQGSNVYFSNADAETGLELWTIDAPGEGARRMIDVHNGPGSSEPRELSLLAGSILFTADDGVHGRELHTSTAAGESRIVMDIRPGAEGSGIHSFHATGNGVYFIANDGETGPELWCSNGTTATTKRLTDINPVQAESAMGPAGLCFVGDALLFAANDGVRGNELWAIPSQDAEAILVKDIYPGRGSSNPEILTAFKNKLYFRAEARDKGYELFESDGTANGTHITNEFVLGPASSAPRSFAVFNDTLFFSASNRPIGDSAITHHLWSTDDGVELIGYPSSCVTLSDAPGNFAVSQNAFFYTTVLSEFGDELWTVLPEPDDRRPYTVRMKEISPETTPIFVSRK